MNILHISDLHFPTSLNPLRLRRKSLIGYANYTFRRKKKHYLHEILVRSIKSSDYDALVISGDITNVSDEREFEEARRILEPILDSRTFIIPGNHDRYTLESLEKKYFEKYFGEFMGEPIPSVEGEAYYIRWKDFKDTRFFGWDSNIPLPPMQAQGYVDPGVAWKTIQFLNESKVQKYMVACHHPIWNPEHRQESDRHRLINREDILEILRNRPPIAYFHGHLHTNWVKEPCDTVPFYVLNSASSTRVSDSRHESGYHALSLKAGEWVHKRFGYDDASNEFIQVNSVIYKGN